MTEDQNKEFDLLQLADEMSHKNWLYFKCLYNKKFKEAEDRTKELESALLKINARLNDIDSWLAQSIDCRNIAENALGEKKDER